MKAVKSLAVVLVLLLGLVWMNCEVEIPLPLQSSSEQDANLSKVSGNMSRVMTIQDRHTNDLLTIKNVIGTATTKLPDGRLAIKILAREMNFDRPIPEVLDGVPVIVEQVGEVKAQLAEGVYIDRYRPVACGVSGGNYNFYRSNQLGWVCDGGTIGCVVKKGGKKYFLSNNHIFAHANREKIGSGIVQPATLDNECSQSEQDIVAKLTDFNQILWGPLRNINEIDAAIAEILPGVDFTCAMICGYTPKSTVAEATLGLEVKKCGRTTGLTYGEVTGVNVTIVVNYMPDGYARFDNQIQFTKLTDSGDSGSLTVTKTGNKPVALQFAGGSTASFGNPIQSVLNYFGVTVCSN